MFALRLTIILCLAGIFSVALAAPAQTAPASVKMRTITGRVLDAAGKPAPDVALHFEQDEPPFSYPYDVATAIDGTFTVSVKKTRPTTLTAVRAGPARYVADITGDIALAGGPRGTRFTIARINHPAIEIHLADARGKAHVLITGPGGAPLPGVNVQLWPCFFWQPDTRASHLAQLSFPAGRRDDYPASGTTGPNGTCDIPALPGFYGVSFSPPADSGLYVGSSENPELLGPTGTTRIARACRRGDKVDLTVVTHDGKPVPGVFPFFTKGNAEYGGSLLFGGTDAHGRWRGVVPAKFPFTHIGVNLPSGASAQAQYTPGKPITITFPKPFTLSGRVTDEAGHPLANVSVNNAAKTDADGRYSIPNFFAGYVYFSSAESRRQAAYLPVAAPTGDTATLDATLRKIPRATITGIVKGAAGDPVHNAKVWFTPYTNGSIDPAAVAVLTDATGAYRIDGITSRSGTVVAQTQTPFRRAATSISLYRKPQITADLTLIPVAVVQITCLDSSRKLLPDAPLRLDFDFTQDDPKFPIRQLVLTSDGAGMARGLLFLPEKSTLATQYTARITRSGAYGPLPVETTLTLKSDTSTFVGTVTFTPPSIIHGTVLDLAGNPVPAAGLDIEQIKDGVGHTVPYHTPLTDWSGNFTFRDLAPGEYVIQASGKVGEKWLRGDTRCILTAQPAHLRITLNPPK